jgi:hypothetical protein
MRGRVAIKSLVGMLCCFGIDRVDLELLTQFANMLHLSDYVARAILVRLAAFVVGSVLIRMFELVARRVGSIKLRTVNALQVGQARRGRGGSRIR